MVIVLLVDLAPSESLGQELFGRGLDRCRPIDLSKKRTKATTAKITSAQNSTMLIVISAYPNRSFPRYTKT